ncbi:MAG: hypothetical protein KatS3mg016_1289 [Fimbriimonadales bacterium]|nr:MAG: hypothetical protein KatS3mg016_1289 [Fimbriimonadales bacterium]
MNVPFVIICFGIIALLIYSAVRLSRRINERLAELDAERERNPLDPFSALMELYRLQEERKRGRGR